MSKYDLEFKLSAVKHYELCIDGQKIMAKKLGIDHEGVRK